MALLRKFFNQTRKPEGFLGKLMLSGMNSGHAKLADWGLAHLPTLPVSAAVDLGCGGGRNAGELLKKYPAAQVTAIDYSALCVEKAKSYNRAMIAAGRCTVRQGDVSALDLPYFWPGLEKCFAEAAKVLKPGGVFLICNESDGTDPTGTKFESIIEGMKSYTAQEIEAALKAAGFSQVEIDHHPNKPWIAVLAKK